MSEYNRKWRERNPAKVRAHIAVNNATRTGKLVPQPCEVCSNKPAQAHHDDYAKPLEVRWLCSGCHVAQHHGTPEERSERKRAAQRERDKRRRPGRKPAKRASLADEAKRLNQEGKSYATIGRMLGVSKATAYKAVNQPSYK